MADTPEDVPYQSLYRRFRPSTFGEVRGQDHVVLALRNAVRDRRVAHAYLFSGPRGTGKTSTARILAMALNCTDLRDGEPCGVCLSCVEIAKGTSLDVHELDAASNNGVEAMRDLVSRAALGTPGRQKVYIVDEVHMLSTAASNALLKTLEEPPAHVVFVLATTDPQKVLPTIRSRTQHFEFRLLGPETLGALLDQVRRDARLDVPDEALALAVRRGRGSARDALSVLDQVVASDSVDDDLPELDEVVEALAERDIGRALVAVAHLTSAGYSPQQLAGDLVDYLRQGFLALVAPDLMAVSGSERDSMATRAERVGLAALVRAMEVLGRAQVTMRDAPDPRVDLEVALVRLAHPEADESPEALLARIERLESVARSGEPPRPLRLRRRPRPRPGHRSCRILGDTPSRTVPTAAEPVVDRRALGAFRRQAGPGPDGEDVGEATPVPTPGPAPAPAGATTAGQAAPEPPGVVPTPPPDGPFPTRDQLVQAWGDHVIGRLRPKAKALFQAGRFVGAERDRAVFGLPNEIHRKRCEEVRGEIEAALSEQFGRPVLLELVVDPSADAPTRGRAAPPPDDPASVSGRSAGNSGTNRSSASTTVSTTVSTTASVQPDAPTAPDRPGGPVDHHEPDDHGDLAAFDESELGDIAEIDNSAEARVLEAFPGAEEVI